MRTHYDPDADALMVVFCEGDIAESEEVKPGVILDYDADGKIVAMEILDVSEHMPPDARAQLQAAE